MSGWSIVVASGVCLSWKCRLPLPIYDHVATRRWRHLDHGECQTWLHARILERVYCLEHGLSASGGAVGVAGARYTLAFERHAIDVLLGTDALGVTHACWNLELGRGVAPHGAARGRAWPS